MEKKPFNRVTEYQEPYDAKSSLGLAGSAGSGSDTQAAGNPNADIIDRLLTNRISKDEGSKMNNN